jgi:CRISPR-associated protein Cmr1
LNWGRLRSQASCDKTGLLALHQAECRLFGSAANDYSSSGQGCFLMSIQQDQIQAQSDLPRTPGRAYLAGLGLGNRPSLPPGANFSVSLLYRPKTSDPLIADLSELLRLVGLFGGLGSRSRRGYGSIVSLVKEKDSWRLPTESELIAECAWIKTKLNYAPTGLSPFSTLVSSSLFFRSSTDYSSWQEAMEKVGVLLNRYRTNGTSVKKRNGIVTRTASTGCRIAGNIDIPNTPANFPFFTTDHNQVYNIASTLSITPPNNVAPERSIFGIPHPYFFSSNGAKVNFDFVPPWPRGNSTKGRRASPLFIHIATFTNAQNQVRYRPLLLLLPAQFLPANSHLDVSVGRHRVGVAPIPTNYTPIHNFLTKHFTAC